MLTLKTSCVQQKVGFGFEETNKRKINELFIVNASVITIDCVAGHVVPSDGELCTNLF